MIQSVTVGLLLGLQHKSAEGVGVHKLLLPVLKDHGLKPVPGVDVADDLGGILEGGFQNGQLFLLISGGIQREGIDDALVENGGGLSHRHGVIPVQNPVGEDALIVESVAQLMGQGGDGGEGAVKIGKNPALLHALNGFAESTAGLAGAGIEVDPLLPEGPVHQIGQLSVKGGKLFHQICPGAFGGKFGGGLSHRGEDVIPGQAAFVAQSFCFGFQIPPEMGQVFVHGTQHGVQSGTAHVGLLQGPVQWGSVATEFTVRQGFQLNGVQGKGHRALDGIVAGNFCPIGILSHLGVRIIGKIPDGRQIDDLAPVVDRHGAGEAGVQVGPGTAAGQLHFGHDLLTPAGQQVAAVFPNVFKEEAVLPQHLILFNQLHQIRQRSGPGLKSGLRGGGAAEQSHDPAQLGLGIGVPGVGILPQRGVHTQLLGQGSDVLQQTNTLLQTLQGGHGHKTAGEGG